MKKYKLFFHFVEFGLILMNMNENVNLSDLCKNRGEDVCQKSFSMKKGCLRHRVS